MNMFAGRWLVLVSGCMLLGTACEPVSEQERQFFETREREQDERRRLMQSLTDANTSETAITMVQEHVAPEGTGTVEDWLRRERAQLEGDVMFPRWESQRVENNRFDVRFSYTHIDRDHNITRTGYEWRVDTVMKDVSEPKTLTEEDLEWRPRRTAIQDEYEKATESFSLE